MSLNGHNHTRGQNLRTGKYWEPHWFHFLHCDVFTAISKQAMCEFTHRASFHDSTCTPDIAASPHPPTSKWLTHHFLSIFAFRVSVMKILISYWHGKKKRPDKQPGSLCNAGLPQGRQRGLWISRGARLPHAKAAGHTGTMACSPEHSTERHCLLVSMHF